MTLHVRDHGGDGPRLVLLHGAGRSLADWDAVAAQLRVRHRVLAVELPGHGHSPDITPWAVPTVVRRIAEALDAHGVAEPVVIGHSLGGLVAVEYARVHSVRAAVNLDGFWWGRPGTDRRYARDGPASSRVGGRVGHQVRSRLASQHVVSLAATTFRVFARSWR